MINKGLRIMIADPEHIQRLRLERDFNRQGYYAIAPVSSLDDMFTLLNYGGRGFDLVLINASLGVNAGVDLHSLCLEHSVRVQICVYNLSSELSVNS